MWFESPVLISAAFFWMIAAVTKIWAAGVQASPLGRILGVEVDPGARDAAIADSEVRRRGASGLHGAGQVAVDQVVVGVGVVERVEHVAPDRDARAGMRRVDHRGDARDVLGHLPGRGNVLQHRAADAEPEVALPERLDRARAPQPARQRAADCRKHGAVFATATVSGPLLGGLVVDSPLGWRGCFMIGLPVAALAFGGLLLLGGSFWRLATIVTAFGQAATIAIAPGAGVRRL